MIIILCWSVIIGLCLFNYKSFKTSACSTEVSLTLNPGPDLCPDVRGQLKRDVLLGEKGRTLLFLLMNLFWQTRAQCLAHLCWTKLGQFVDKMEKIFCFVCF